MTRRTALVGRQVERKRLEEAFRRAQQGSGSLVLLAGEAGVGKTRLAGEVAGASGTEALWGAANHGATEPYGPIVAVLRSFLRSNPGGLAGAGPLPAHLALLLPELGAAPADSDRPTLFEAVRWAFAHIAADRVAVVVLDDLQWSDGATLELLSALAEPLAEMPVLILGSYRSDGLPRDHMLRRLRNDLRRAGRLHEVTLEPLELADVSVLLAELLGEPVSPALARTIHDRAQGIPFFVEELARALHVSGSLATGRRGLELAGGGDVRVPGTIRDAVLMSAAELSGDARAAVEVAAVAGASFHLEVAATLSGEVGLAELIERGVLAETSSGVGSFRHALTRDALYADVPWLRRRTLHRRFAEALEAGGAPSMEVATHWLGARDSVRAREALLRAARESQAVHAYRDAALAGRQALELWPDGEQEEERIATLASYAHCAELCGDLPEAVRAWREVCAIRAEAGGAAMADAQRRLAATYELVGEREAAFAAREVAAAAYGVVGRTADAAVEHLAMANYLRGRARYAPAIELAQAAGQEAALAERLDLRARAFGLEGVARAKGGESARGLDTVREGLALALEHNLTPVAAELYQRLSLVLYDSSDYRRAQEALDAALTLCRTGDQPGTEEACFTCMVYVLRERGEWIEAIKLGRELIAAGTGVWVAEELIGAIHAFQGKFSSARRLLTSSNATAVRLGQYSMSVDSTAALAWIAAAEGAPDEAIRHCAALLDRWESSEDHHYAVWGLRWAAGFLARQGDTARAHACGEALTRIASDSGYTDALAALAHAIAEVALAAGDVDTAAEQHTRAVELHRTLDIPVERAQIELRAGVALAAAGERELALERLGDAYRTARKLGARPIAADAAREVAALGESVVQRLGRRAAADADGAGLSRRELEVVRLVAVGHTNREIAQQLFLSPRTVDMHVRNVLRKLDCRSRVEAAHRAGELGLLV